MRFLPATEDFVLRTLSAVDGRWSKLQYVVSLRDQDGTYRHWGLARLYGEEQAGRTLESAHQQLFLEVLRTPLRELWADVRQTARGRGAPESEFVRELEAAGRALVPRDYAGGSLRHFNSVLAALSGLARQGPTHPGA
jgi:hypothetical protein